MTTHHLVADDNGSCISQAQFTPTSDGKVQVLALMGATQYVDRVMGLEEARAQYKELLELGWTIPLRTPVLSRAALKTLVYN